MPFNNELSGFAELIYQGQPVYEIHPEIVYNRNHVWEINTSDFKPGIYFYSVTAENNQITKKMIVD